MEHIEAYKDWLDEVQPIHNGLPYSILLERADSIAFNCGYADFLDSQELTEEEEF